MTISFKLISNAQFTAETTIVTMVTTIEQAIRPLILTSSLIGLGMFSSKRLYLNLFYNLTVWIVYGCLFYHIVTTLKLEVFYLSVYAMVDVQIGVLTSIISGIVNIYLNKRFQIFIKKLVAVDNTLEELGIPKLYNKLHMYAKRLLIGWLICSNVGNMGDMVWWFYAKTDRRYMLVPLIMNYYYHVNMFADSLFLIILWYIGTRFEKINEYLKYLLIKEEHKFKCSRTKAILITRRYITDKRVLWTSMHLHLELCQITHQLNIIFGIQITMQLGAYIVLMLRLCNYIYIHIKTESRFIVTSFNWFDLNYWLFLHIAKIFFFNYICETVSTKSNEIEKVIHQLTDLHQYADIRDELFQFVLQIKQRPLKITGLDFFDFGYSFLRNFVMTIITFIIIIMQMSSVPFKEFKEYPGY